MKDPEIKTGMKREDLLEMTQEEAVDILLSIIAELTETTGQQILRNAELRAAINRKSAESETAENQDAPKTKPRNEPSVPMDLLEPPDYSYRALEKPKKPLLIYAALGILCVFFLGAGGYLLYGSYGYRIRFAAASLSNSLRVPVAELPTGEYCLDVCTEAEHEGEEVNTVEDTEDVEDAETEVTEVDEMPARREPNPHFIAQQAFFNNPDIIGHLYIAGTGINYYVVQGEDNEFYLYHDIWRNPSSAGWIFLDYEVDLHEENQNTVIYGHNMAQGIRFADIRHFQSYSFFREHPFITFNTLYGNYKWEIFSFYVAHISFPYTVINIPDTDTWAVMLELFKINSLYDTGVTVTPLDRILTLSTCTNANPDHRFVLHAKLTQVMF